VITEVTSHLTDLNAAIPALPASCSSPRRSTTLGRS